MDLILLRLSFAMVISWSGVVGQNPTRGPHHPRGEPLSPEAHRHHRPPEDKLTRDEGLLHDSSHIQEDLGIPVENMTDEQLEFHYFNLHDFDKNKHLDGLELLKAVYHTLDHNHHEEEHENEENTGNELDHDPSYLSPEDEEITRYIELIDKLLEEDDLDKDGFISYPEFSKGRSKGRKEEITAKLQEKMVEKEDKR